MIVHHQVSDVGKTSGHNGNEGGTTTGSQKSEEVDILNNTKLLKAWVGWGLLYGPNPGPPQLLWTWRLWGCWQRTPVGEACATSDGWGKQKINYGTTFRVQELCESRGGCPGLPVLTSHLVSVDVKQYWTILTHWSQLVPNMSINIWGHEALLHHHHHPPFHSVSWSTECHVFALYSCSSRSHIPLRKSRC